MDEVELARWLDALVEQGLINEWHWRLENEPGELTEVYYLIDGRRYTHAGAVKLVRDFETVSMR